MSPICQPLTKWVLGQGDLASDWQLRPLNHPQEDQFFQWLAKSAFNKHKKQYKC